MTTDQVTEDVSCCGHAYPRLHTPGGCVVGWRADEIGRRCDCKRATPRETLAGRLSAADLGKWVAIDDHPPRRLLYIAHDLMPGADPMTELDLDGYTASWFPTSAPCTVAAEPPPNSH